MADTLYSNSPSLRDQLVLDSKGYTTNTNLKNI